MYYQTKKLVSSHHPDEMEGIFLNLKPKVYINCRKAFRLIAYVRSIRRGPKRKLEIQESLDVRLISDLFYSTYIFTDFLCGQKAFKYFQSHAAYPCPKNGRNQRQSKSTRLSPQAEARRPKSCSDSCSKPKRTFLLFFFVLKGDRGRIRKRAHVRTLLVCLFLTLLEIGWRLCVSTFNYNVYIYIFFFTGLVRSFFTHGWSVLTSALVLDYYNNNHSLLFFLLHSEFSYMTLAAQNLIRAYLHWFLFFYFYVT